MADGMYSWEDPVWNNNDATGAAAPQTWDPNVDVTGDFPKFAAGTDAGTLTYTVTVGAAHTINGMQLATGGGGTVNINTTGAGALNVGTGLQGLFVATNGNLKLNAALGGVDPTSALQWSGGGGSAFLYGANTFQGGVSLNSANGLNFNNSASFGTGPITYSAALGTAVLANPDAGNFTINNPLTMRDNPTGNVTMIYTGVAPVTFNDWTLGVDGVNFSNVITVGNNAFKTAKLIINNLKGAPNSNLTVNSSAGVSGTLVLNGTSTYSGETFLGTGTTGTPTLQADEGFGLLTTSDLVLNGGVFQTHGTFNRTLSTTSGVSTMAWNTGGGGFSAIGSQLTVDIGGAGAELGWGDTVADEGLKILGPLKFGSVTSNAKTLFIDPIDLNATATTGLTRTVTVAAGVGGDQTEMSGAIRNTGADTGLTKNGDGTLVLSGANTYSGATTISAGTLLANTSSGSATGTGAVTVASTGTLGGTGRVGGAVTNNGIIAPGNAGVGTLFVGGGVTDGASSSWSIELSGALADKLAVTGNIDLSASDSLNITGTGTGTSWLIGTYTGTLTGTFDNVTAGYTVSYGSGNITLNAASLTLLGDFNSDGTVDAGDYVTWRKNDAANLPLANDNGAGNQAARYSLWRANFGNAGPGSGSGLGNSGAAVPEPASAALFLLGFAALGIGLQGRRKYSIVRI
jgi:autotransporter-associated beta strand protein